MLNNSPSSNQYFKIGGKNKSFYFGTDVQTIFLVVYYIKNVMCDVENAFWGSFKDTYIGYFYEEEFQLLCWYDEKTAFWVCFEGKTAFSGNFEEEISVDFQRFIQAFREEDKFRIILRKLLGCFEGRNWIFR